MDSADFDFVSKVGSRKRACVQCLGAFSGPFWCILGMFLLQFEIWLLDHFEF